MSETDPDAAVRLHQSLTEIDEQLNEAEQRWMELSATIQGDG
jgi:ATP-binding cassette subfamily F protein 3